MPKLAMRSFDEMCLFLIEEMMPTEIRRLRLRDGASRAVFARHLNVTAGLASQWECGVKRLGGASLKLLNLVAKKD